MLLLYDVQRVGAGDAVELRRVFMDSSILCCIDVFVALLDEFSTLAAAGYKIFFEVTDESCLLHSESAGHYIQSKVSYLIWNGVLCDDDPESVRFGFAWMMGLPSIVGGYPLRAA